MVWPEGRGWADLARALGVLKQELRLESQSAGSGVHSAWGEVGGRRWEEHDFLFVILDQKAFVAAAAAPLLGCGRVELVVTYTQWPARCGHWTRWPRAPHT